MKNKIKHLKTTILMKSSTWKCMNFISNVTYNNKTTKYKNKMKERLRKLCNERERERESYQQCFYDDDNNLFMPVFCSEVSLVGNLMLNLILRLPFLEGSFGIGIPSPLTTSS